MDRAPLYQQIAEAVRQEILQGALRPGDMAPTVREMADRWHCTPGTVQLAYKELARQGLLVGRAGQGTRVGTSLPSEQHPAGDAPLRRAALVHRAEAFLLEVLAAGYRVPEIESGLRAALDRWRAQAKVLPRSPGSAIHFVGSHDLAVSLIASRFSEIAPGYSLNVSFTGSLGGLIALAEGKADIAGTHLWDKATDSYNVPFVQRLLPGQPAVLLNLAHRELGLAVAPENPLRIEQLGDLAQRGVRFVNRQRGSGTRVWLDAQLADLALDPAQIVGYPEEKATHSEVAQAVAEGDADVGLTLKPAALLFGLVFLPLTTERYDLVILRDTWESPPIQFLAEWLPSADAKSVISALGGYDTKETGMISWVGRARARTTSVLPSA